MAKKSNKRLLELQFPFAGLNRGVGYQSLPPYTTPDCLNVWPIASVQRRRMGASRPGMSKTHYEQLGSGGIVRMLTYLDVVRTDSLTYFSDRFNGSGLATVWGIGASGTTGHVLNGLASVDTQNFLAQYGTVAGNGETGAYADPTAFSPAIDTSKDFDLAVYIVPWQNRYGGTADGTTCAVKMYGKNGAYFGDPQNFVCTLTLSTTAGDGTYSSNLSVNRYDGGMGMNVTDSYAGASGDLGSVKPGWFRVKWTQSTGTVNMYWQGTLLKSQAITAPSGPAAFGNYIGWSFDTNYMFIGEVLFQYYSSQTGLEERSRRLLLASAGGTVYRETNLGTMTSIGGSLTLASDRRIRAVGYQGVLYIADNGVLNAGASDGTTTAGGLTLDSATYTNWTTLGLNANDFTAYLASSSGGTAITAGMYAVSGVAAGNLTLSTSNGGDGTTTGITFRVERSPKIYTDSTGAMTRWVATAGMVPLGCTLICEFLGRIYLSGARNAPYAWYASRQGDPLDWDYNADATDQQRAVAGVNTLANDVGAPITAMLPYNNDFLVFGALNQIFMLRGDPASGGRIDLVSTQLGIIGPDAACFGPSGEMYFMSLQGLAVLPPGGSQQPVLLSRKNLPNDLLNIDANLTQVSMVWDNLNGGVHIFVTPNTNLAGYHWFWDAQDKGFFPMLFPVTQNPYSVLNYQPFYAAGGGVMLGCKDGYLRMLKAWATNDDGTAITSYVKYGPLKLGGGNYQAGMILEMLSILPLWSNDVTAHVQGADTSENALNSPNTSMSLTISGNDSTRYTTRVTGGSGVVKLSSTTAPWAVDTMTLMIEMFPVLRKS